MTKSDMDLRNYGTLLNEKAAQKLAERQHHQKKRARRAREAHSVTTRDTRTWMSCLPDDTPLSALTLPGTHDSAAYKSIWPFVSTQTLSVTQQLDLGIRYMDFRCGLRNNVLEMVHGRALLDRTLPSLLADIYHWLSTHPTECLALQLKQDRAPESSTVDFSTAVFALIAADAERWSLSATTPCLGSVRGRIHLLRRFALSGPRPYRTAGIDVARWPDNPPAPVRIRNRLTTVVVQDHYNPSRPVPLQGVIEEKVALVEEMLSAATAQADAVWYLNFCSAYQLNVRYQSAPRDIAVGGWSGVRYVEGVNRRLKTWLMDAGPGRRRLGVVLLDFPEAPDPELVGLLVATNFGPKKEAWRIGGRRWRTAVWMMAALLVAIFLAGLVLVVVRGRPKTWEEWLQHPSWRWREIASFGRDT